jgi:hypothetical protein
VLAPSGQPKRYVSKIEIMKRRTFLKTLVWTGFAIKSNIFDINLFIKEKIRKIRTIDISDESTEGGIITCFIDGDILSKIQIEQCWESGRYYEKILLNNDGSIFRVDEVETVYNVPFNFTEDLAKEIGSDAFDEKKSIIAKNTYHFRNDQVTQYALSSKKPVDIKKVEEQCRSIVHFVFNKINNSNFYA